MKITITRDREADLISQWTIEIERGSSVRTDRLYYENRTSLAETEAKHHARTLHAIWGASSLDEARSLAKAAVQ